MRVRAQLGLLQRAPDFRLLFLATVASSIGTWLAFVALVIDVFDRTGSANWVSALLVVEFLPIIVVGLAAGPLIDRLPRRSILVGSDLARAAVFVVLPFAGDALQIVLLAAVAGVATSVFRPAVYAGLPNLVRGGQLSSANGLLQAADNLTWVLGSLLGGALVAVSGPEPAYWANAATFLVSAFLLLRVRATMEETRDSPRAGHWPELLAGLRVARRSPALLAVAVAWSVVLLGNACVNVAEVVLAKEVFSAGDFGYGLLLAAAAIGLVLGSLFASDWISVRGLRIPYAVSIVLMAIGFGAAAASPNVWAAAAFVTFAGFGNGVAVVCNAVLVQRGSPDQLRGRAFTVIMSVGTVSLALGTVIAGPLTSALGARPVWAIAAGLFVAASVLAYSLLGRAPSDELHPEPTAPASASGEGPFSTAGQSPS